MNDVILFFSQISVLLAYLVGLWVAARFMKSLLPAINRWENRLGLSDGIFPILVWLALGTLLAAPVIDLFGSIQSLFTLLRITDLFEGMVGSSWGSAPVALFDGLNLGMTLLVYGFVLWSGRKFIEAEKHQALADYPLNKAERIYLLLILAAFSHSFVRIVVNSTVFLNFPTSTVRGPLGFVAGWILGAVIFLAIFRFLDYRLSLMEGNEAVEV